MNDEKKAASGVAAHSELGNSDNKTSVAKTHSINKAVNSSPIQINSIGEKSFYCVATRSTYYFKESQGVSRKKPEQNTRFLGPWIEVIADLVGEKHSEPRRLVVFRDLAGNLCKVAIPFSIVMGPYAKLIQELARYGFNIGAGSQSGVAEYLRAFPSVQIGRIVDRPGWVLPGKLFACPFQGEVEFLGAQPSEVIHYSGDPKALPFFGQKGTLDEWKASICDLTRHSTRLQFFMLASLAGPLLALTEEDSGGFHLYGDTSQGKTTALRVAATVWASSRSREIRTWASTSNAFEELAKQRSNFVILLDELSQSSSPEVSSKIYGLANGTPKSRQNKDGGLREESQWRLLCLSTGEVTPRDMLNSSGLTFNTGAEARLVTVPLPKDSPYGIFETVESGMTSQEMVNEIKERGSKFYGVAGPSFVRSLIQDIAQHGNVDDFMHLIAEQRKAWMRKYCANTEQAVNRIAERCSLLAVTGELAIKYNILTWAPGEAEACVAICFQAAIGCFEGVNRKAERLSELVAEIAQTQKAAFDVYKASIEGGKLVVRSLKVHNKEPLLGIVLKNPRNEDAIRIFYPQAFRKAIRDAGESLMDVLRALNKRHLLKYNNGEDHLTYKIPKTQKLFSFFPPGSYFVILGEEAFSNEDARKSLLKTNLSLQWLE